MKTVILMFDSLNRRLLEPYGASLQTPNFQRLADRALTYDRSYCCSMPCMPARRDFHTGRPGFLHRDWGPLEPFDDSVPEMLKEAGTHTHLTSDHYHYWEEGGANYHTRYSTWECFRGQEADPWIGQVAAPDSPPSTGKNDWHAFPRARQDWVNRPFMAGENQHSQTRTLEAGLDFIRRNASQDNWMLQIECFDPHEPFFTPERFKERYEEFFQQASDDPFCDWPTPGKNPHDPKVTRHIQACNAALHSMCDESLGKVMDLLEEKNMWEETLFIVWSDHGILLNEHDYWLKNVMPLYEEIAHTPFFVWDPRHGIGGQRRQSLVQPAIDLGPTLLRFFGLEPTPDMLGHSLDPTIANDTPVRETALFGYFNRHLNITDGRYVYMRARDANHPVPAYTLMPSAMNDRYAPEKFRALSLSESFGFSKNCPLMRFQNNELPPFENETLLFDLESDPNQKYPLHDPEIEERLTSCMRQHLLSCEAPVEQYQSLNLEPLPH